MRKHPVGNLGSRFRDQRSKSSSNYSINFSAKKFIILGYLAGHWSAPGVGGGRDQSGVTKTRGSIKGRSRQGRT